MTPEQIAAIKKEMQTIKDAISIIDFAQSKINKIIAEHECNGK